MEHVISADKVVEFQRALKQCEKSAATIEKYIRDIRLFLQFLARKGDAQNKRDASQDESAPKAAEPCCTVYEEQINKEKVLLYKQYLIDHYAPSSVNSMLAGINTFFREEGWHDCMVRTIKIQKETFRTGKKELTREEYFRLLDTAKKQGNRRLYLLMQTICSTGIRVSELPFVTVESLNSRRAQVSLKGKTRIVILPLELCRELKRYIREQQIHTGSIFVTRSGKCMDRCNIWREMKKLCEMAGISREKVFPHNLRHLFACTYYRMEKDISHLADILGHSSINTTRIYTMENWTEQERKIGRLGLVI